MRVRSIWHRKRKIHKDKVIPTVTKEATRFRSVLIRKFTNFGRDVVFSADLCYNGDNEKASPLGRGGGEADGEG